MKKFAPNLWENTGGYVKAGETSIAAVLRELTEETGIIAEENEIHYIGSSKVPPFFGDNYYIRRDILLNEIILQDGETSDVKWVTHNELFNMADTGELAPSVMAHLAPIRAKFEAALKSKPSIYIASKLENYEQVRCLSEKLKLADWVHTYDWTIHGSVKSTNMAALRFIGQKEFDGVKNADIVIILTPQGRGTHTEFGMAIALNKRIYLCHSDDSYFKFDDNTSSFYWLPQVTHLVGNIQDIADRIICSN